MTTYKSLLARAAATLSILAAVTGGLFIAPVAHADIGYGSPQVYTVGDQVCAGRYDPNCLQKENNYLVTTSLYNQQPYYNPNTYNARYTPVPYVYNTPTYVAPRTTPYVPYVAPSYSYQYQYSYSYPQTYSYSYPSYSYSYNTPTYYSSSYGNSYYDDCDYSYDCDY